MESLGRLKYVTSPICLRHLSGGTLLNLFCVAEANAEKNRRLLDVAIVVFEKFKMGYPHIYLDSCEVKNWTEVCDTMNHKDIRCDNSIKWKADVYDKVCAALRCAPFDLGEQRLHSFEVWEEIKKSPYC